MYFQMFKSIAIPSSIRMLVALLSCLLLLVGAGCSGGEQAHSNLEAREEGNLTSKSAAPSTPPASSSQGVELMTVPLLAGQSTHVGTVTTRVEGNSLLVRYFIASPWSMTESHLDIQNDWRDIPQTRNHNPIPGRFLYSSHHAPGVNEYVYRLELSYAPGTMLSLATHAVVTRTSQAGTSSESAWGAGTRFNEQGNWATFFSFTLPFSNVLLVHQPSGWPGTDEELALVQQYLEDLGIPYTTLDLGSQGLTHEQVQGYDVIVLLSYTSPLQNQNTVTTLVDFFERGGGIVASGDDVTWVKGVPRDSQFLWEGLTRLEHQDNGAIGLHSVRIPISRHPVVEGIEGSSFVYPLDIDNKRLMASGPPVILATATLGAVDVGPAIIAYERPEGSGGRLVLINMGFYNGIDTTPWNGAPYMGPTIPRALATRLLSNSLRWLSGR